MGTIWLDEVGCTGTETVISECDHSGWAIHDCSHLEDAGVRCSGELGVCGVRVRAVKVRVVRM